MLPSSTITFESHPPGWFPFTLKARLQEHGSLEYAGRMPRAVRKVMRKRKRVRPSRWLEKHYVVTQSSIPGPWRNETLPYLPPILDAAQYPSVEKIIICKSPQVGATEAVNGFVAYTVDCAPGPVLYVYPDELTARDNSKDRIQPAITESPQLRAYLTGTDDDVASLRIKLQHVLIYLAWARSAARLANRPIRYPIFDEIDKYPETAGKRETDPISLGEKRATTYAGRRKIFKFSSPTVESAPIWQALLKEAQVVFDFWVKCPACHTLQLMMCERIRVVPKDERDPQTIKAGKLARYQCSHCDEYWSDDQRNRAVAMGGWRQRPADWQKPGSNWKTQRAGTRLFGCLRRHRPANIAFHIPSWLSRFVSLSEILADFFEADSEFKTRRNKTKLKDFCNARRAEPWVEYEVQREEDAILALRDDRPRGLVPAGNLVAGLTGAVDTHDDGFHYEIRAWGRGLQEESWQVREGFALSFAALEEILFITTYQDIGGNDYFVHFTVIDAMGHRTKEVYDWCVKHRGRVLPLKGEERMRQPYAFSRINTYPGTKKPLPYEITLVRADVNYYKNHLSNKLQVPPADPGAWHMHGDMTDAWAQQMCAEYVNNKGLWECPPGKANEAWDVSVYGLVCADIIGVRFWAEEVEEGHTEKPATPERLRSRWMEGRA